MAALASRIILFSDTVDNIIKLMPAGSEQAQLFEALGELRFKGRDREILQCALTGDCGYAFDLLSQRIEKDMKRYLAVCARNAGSAARTETGAVGGGMLIQPDSMQVLIRICQGTEAGTFLQALYDVQFKGKSADEVEESLTGRPQMLFTMVRYSLLSCAPSIPAPAPDDSPLDPDVLSTDPAPTRKKPRKKNISDSERRRINKDNAMRGWKKRRAAQVQAQTEKEADALAEAVPSAPVSDATCVSSTNPYKDIPEVAESSNLPGDANAKVDANSHELRIDDGSESYNYGNASYEIDAISHAKKKQKLEEYISPPTPSCISHSRTNDKEDKLDANFNMLLEAYPNHVQIERARREFMRIKPDNALFDEIMTGLTIAKREDRRFLGEARYIPFLANWLRDEGWKKENMIPVPPRVNNTYHRSAAVSYAQRPYKTPEEIKARKRRAIMELAKRYGDSEQI